MALFHTAEIYVSPNVSARFPDVRPKISSIGGAYAVPFTPDPFFSPPSRQHRLESPNPDAAVSLTLRNPGPAPADEVRAAPASAKALGTTWFEPSANTC